MLRLITDQGHKLTMSIQLQILNDFFVAETKAYKLFCLRSFREFVEPHMTRENEYAARNYYYTLDVYSTVYGERPVSEIWMSGDK